MINAPIKFGILSAAHYHATHWTNAALTNADVDFVGLWDDNEARGREAADSLGVEFVGDLAEMLEQCDAVGITSETVKHVSLVEAAASVGVHVLVEKPMGRSLAECVRIQNVVESTGVTYMQNFTKRYDPAHHELLEILRAGEIGDITMVRIRHGNDLKFDRSTEGGWYADQQQAGGGALLDEGVHGADLMNWILGYPSSVVAVSTAGPTPQSTDVQAIALYEYPSGAIGELVASHNFAGGEASVEVYGTLGVAIMSGVDLGSRELASAPFLKTALHGEEEFTGRSVVPGFREGKASYHGKAVHQFIKTLTQDAPLLVSFEDGWKAVAMIEAAYSAIATGSKTDLPTRLPSELL
jgi:myo-inositol 2-dehydrogenase/D-chiro-inositol 1-dehydrogenase